MGDVKAVATEPSQRFPSPRKGGTDAVRAFHGYVSMQGRGTIAIPPALRQKYGLDKPGAQIEITEREDGVLEMRPLMAVPASEAWFWEERWQAGEREVDRLYADGEYETFDGPEAFMAHLDELSAQ